MALLDFSFMGCTGTTTAGLDRKIKQKRNYKPSATLQAEIHFRQRESRPNNKGYYVHLDEKQATSKKKPTVFENNTQNTIS